LPRETQLQIFRHLSKLDLLAACKVSRVWRSLALDGSHWTALDVRGWHTAITDAQLLTIAEAAGSFVRHVNLRGCMQLQAPTLNAITVHAINLESLTLAGCRALTAWDIGAALTSLPSLRRLDLSGLLTVTERSMAQLDVPRLEELNLTRCRNLSAIGLWRVLMEGVGPGLTTLRIGGCERAVNNDLLANIGLRYPRLAHLSLADCNAITDTGLIKLVQGCRQLDTLSLSRCHRLTDMGIGAIGEHCPQLARLDLAGCIELTSDGLEALSRGCHQLTQIDLEDCVMVDDEGLHALAAGCPRLQDVALGFCDAISDDGVFALIAGCPGLKCLAVDNCSSISNEVLTRI
ncbi:hypothetical protein SYNPS1DRAFT_3989, partial [Syncephalis pseudoplumigaleata]